MMPAFGPLETPRLRMRRYREDDLERMHEVMSDPAVMRYYPAPFERDKSQKALSNVLAAYKKFGYSLLAVERKSDGRFIGHVGLLHWDGVDGREDVEVAYMLRPAYWGCGYATEAARASKDWAFERLGVDRVVSFIAVENRPSMNVAERTGMLRLKRLDDNTLGQPIYVYGITRAAWSDLPNSG